MNIEPEITDAPTTEALAGIPPTSPYYDEVQSLIIDIDFAPYGSPLYHHLNSQIAEMRRREQQRTEAINRATLNHCYDK